MNRPLSKVGGLARGTRTRRIAALLVGTGLGGLILIALASVVDSTAIWSALGQGQSGGGRTWWWETGAVRSYEPLPVTSSGPWATATAGPILVTTSPPTPVPVPPDPVPETPAPAPRTASPTATPAPAPTSTLPGPASPVGPVPTPNILPPVAPPLPADYVRLSVQVLDAVTGTPIRAACLVIGTSTCGASKPHTNASGMWWFDVPPPHSAAEIFFDVVVLKDGYATAWKRVGVADRDVAYTVMLAPASR